MKLILLGSLFLVGLLADVVGRSTPVPRVSVLLISGLAIGPSILGIVTSEHAAEWFPPLTQMALGMVGFLMGQTLTSVALREHGWRIVLLSLVKVIGAAAAVFAVCRAFDIPSVLALVLAGIAPATAPAATFDVVHETGMEGEFGDTLVSVVALDDVWGLLLFSFLLALAGSSGGDVAQMAVSGLLGGTVEIGLSVLLGLALGLPMAFLTGRIDFGSRSGEPILAESLGFVFVAAGLAGMLDLSPIVVAITMGIVVANVATHHSRPFTAIEGVEWPFMILFFVIAGASLHIEALPAAGWLVAGYVLARALGIVAGVWCGARMSGLSRVIGRWLGVCLLPQAGVALGMSLMAAQRFPEHAQVILTVVLSSTVLLELTSPVLTRWVLLNRAL